MTDSDSPIVLQRKVLPWLRSPLRQLEAASVAGRLGHAWLICGPRGVGKLNLSLVFSEWLLRDSKEADEPDVLRPTEAQRAMQFRHSPYDHHADLHWVHPAEDKATISVDQIRSVSESLILKSFNAPAKIVIIEPADALTTAAANALLKTLEEPTDDTYLLLLSERPDLLPATIRSRCQKLILRRPNVEALAQWLGTEDLGPDIPQTDPYLASLSPLELVGAQGRQYLSEYTELEDRFEGICDGKLDPLEIAGDWAKSNLDHILNWLVLRVQFIVRARMSQRGSNPVTESSDMSLHNVCRELSLQTLFSQLERAESLRNQLGTGVNAELALRVLLLGFRPDREKA